MRVAIIGAGVGGLACALALRQIGAEVTVFEQRSEPATGGAGLLLQPSGLAAMAALGVDTIAGMPAITRLEGRRADGQRVLDLDYRRYPGGTGHGSCAQPSSMSWRGAPGRRGPPSGSAWASSASRATASRRGWRRSRSKRGTS